MKAATMLALVSGTLACLAPPARPLVCSSVVEGCSCGGIGCPCADDGRCDEGSCNEDSDTCVLEAEGMVYVPAGAFWMGCREGFDTDEVTGPCPIDELPYRQVTLDAYWIDQLEVGKGEYRACMDAGVCTVPYLWDQEHYEGPVGEGMFVAGPESFPAASISWTQASDYCEWVGKRLPTEAEWEKAARGGDGRKYPWGSEVPTCEDANYGTVGESCEYEVQYITLTPRGLFPAGSSPFGAQDMAGNVNEWTTDGMETGIGYGSLPTENPTGIESDNGRALRGGGYQSAILAAGGYVLRTSLRRHGLISWTALTLDHGFRCAKDAD
ncbi:formylglycine-generating enzyme family protein [Nannocystaceae bacterium ST9]